MKARRQSFRYTKSPCGSQWLLWWVMLSHITKDNRKYSHQAFAMQTGMVAQHEIRVLSVYTSISQLLQNKWKVATVNYLPGSTQINIHSIIKWIFYYLSGRVPQSDWHTVLALFCITTVYQTQLVCGSHRWAYDPEKFFKVWEIRESLFGKKKVKNCSIMMLPFSCHKMDWGHFYLWFVKNILLHGRTRC